MVFDDDSSAAWNEMFSAPGSPRPIYERLFAELGRYQPAELRQRSEQLSNTFSERGVTFRPQWRGATISARRGARLIGAMEWTTSRGGFVSGCRPLRRSSPTSTATVASSPSTSFRDRSSRRVPHFCRPAFAVDPPNGVRITVAGIDLVRDEMGNFRILEDNVRIPSGVSYVIENRRAMTQTFSSLFSDHRVHPVDSYPAHLFAALRAAAPPNVTDPVIVVLSPGVHNAAYFEHVLLARMMGAELVEGRDLLCRSNHAYMPNDERRTTGARDLSPASTTTGSIPCSSDRTRSSASPTGELRARRERGHLQRNRQRRRRRQTRLHLRAGVHPLLFERRAAD